MRRIKKTAGADGAVQMADEAQILAGLNPEQEAVVRHGAGPLLVGAVAGAGKTRALVCRVAMLVRGGVNPARILATTFSVKAAAEMNERLGVLVPGGEARIGTLHSLALQIVKTERGLDGWEVDDSDRYRYIVKDTLGWKGMKWETADLTLVMQFIGRAKAQPVAPGSREAAEFAAEFHAKAGRTAQTRPALLAEAYARAEEMRLERRVLTFDDMLVDAHDMLATDATVRGRWAGKYDYVMQDEAQDENPVQRKILVLLASEHRNYMVVGDPAQSIYAFRGADPTGLVKFEGEWGATVVRMHRNYRCGSRIIDAANGVLGQMTEGTHLGMQMTAERGVEGSVEARMYESLDDEGDGVVQEIVAAQASGEVQWRDCAVLYRTNAQSRGVEEACLRARIPYVVIGGTNFYDRKEVKDLLAYIRLAAGRGSFEDVKRSINAPFRFLGARFVEKIEAHVANRRERGTADRWVQLVREACGTAAINYKQRDAANSYADMIAGFAETLDTAAKRIAESGVAAGLNGDASVMAARPARLLEDVLLETRYAEWLSRDQGTESPENNRVSNVRELVRAAERFPTVDELLDYIDTTLAEARKAKDDRGESNRVTLTSLHRSKGLEWPRVWMIGCNDDILPHARAEDINEERRLFYVGTTRARDALVYTGVRVAAVGTKVREMAPSCFLAEAGVVPVAVEGSEPAALTMPGVEFSCGTEEEIED